MSKQRRLSQNGIDKIMQNITGMMLQVLNPEQKNKNNMNYYICDISDGFCKTKTYIICGDDEIHPTVVKNNMVIQILSSNKQASKSNEDLILIEKFNVVQELNQVIGAPISYTQFKKKGRKNQKGDNLIMPETDNQDTNSYKPAKNNYNQQNQQNKANNSKKEVNSKTFNNSRQSEQDDTNNYPKNKSNTNNFKQKEEDYSRQASKRSNSNYQSNFGQQDNSRQVSKSNNSNYQTKLQAGPGKKLMINDDRSKKEESNSRSPGQTNGIRPKQRKSEGYLTQIKKLHVGATDWTIKVRAIFVNPLRMIMTKKGTQSQILSIELCDKSGTIECTMFGQIARRYQESFKQDQVYQISGGYVSQNNYLGKSSLRLSINDETKINIKEDDPKVPYAEDFCSTVKQLLEKPKGEQVRVVCLVKDPKTVQEFISKQGKPMRVKKLLLCDPQQKLEVQASLWNQKADTQFQMFPYIIKGIKVGEYRNNPTFTIQKNFQARIVKTHSFRKYIKDIQNLQFSNPFPSNQGKKQNISNFKALEQAIQRAGNDDVWAEIVCYVNTFSVNATNFYIACPHCRKKVASMQPDTCPYCDKSYDSAQCRYIISINMVDWYQGFWISFNHQVAQTVMEISADQFAKLSKQDMQSHIRNIRYKQLRLKIVNKNEQYKGQVRRKSNAIKILQRNYAQQTKGILQRVKKQLQSRR